MSSRTLRFLLVLAAVSLVAGPASAAAPEGSLRWFTPLAGYGLFSDHHPYPAGWPLDDAPAFGARAGVRLTPLWDLEAGGAWSKPPEQRTPDRGYDATVWNVQGSLLYTLIRTRIGDPYVGAGGGYVRYDSDVAGAVEQHFGTFEQAFGWRAWMGEHTALRIEARNVLPIPYQRWSHAAKADQQLWAGLDFAWGSRPKDADGDGVPDKKDRCPATPKGATVNAQGCPSDADGDGVYDGLDQCPNTPKGARVDARGCPTDADGDGVFDGLDKCADTPKGATVDARGCPVDSDGDGVFDGFDQCPNTPKGAKVDEHGCPTDADGDGVFDGLDKCPGTSPGLRVDSDGCPIEVTEKETQLLDTGMIRLQGVNFATGKSDLLPESYPVLDEVGAVLRKWPQLMIEVGGHTDSRGTAESNQKLSDARANAVRTYLLGKFTEIQGAQLTAKGYGESKPIVPNSNPLNMAKNRRVEFVVLNKDVLRKEIENRKLLKK